MKSKVLVKSPEDQIAKLYINDLDNKTNLKTVLTRIVNSPSYYIIWSMFATLSFLEIFFYRFFKINSAFNVIFFAVLFVTNLMSLLRFPLTSFKGNIRYKAFIDMLLSMSLSALSMFCFFAVHYDL